MAISHADHDHPNTPAARAACRKQMANGDTPLTGNPLPSSIGGIVAKAFKPAKITVVPRKRGDGGVVRGMKDAAPKRVMKTPAGGMIRTPADIPVDCPGTLHYAITTAWDKGWEVVEGYKLNELENRVLIGGKVAQVSVVWNPSNGDSAIFVRKLSSSVTHRADSAQAAIWLASGDDDWPWSN